MKGVIKFLTGLFIAIVIFELSINLQSFHEVITTEQSITTKTELSINFVLKKKQ